jgi:hypothetical protein
VQRPWETGWEPAEGPGAQASLVGTKVINETTYHLWKDSQGNEMIQKNNEFYQVSPGAFATIPLADNLGTNQTFTKSDVRH